MSSAVKQMLNTFEGLPEADKHQAAIGILRRVSKGTEGDLPESTLLQAADQLFQALDAEEAANGQS